MHLSTSYAKILGETNFQPREIPRSGTKAKDGKEKKREKERPKVGNNNGQLSIATPPRVAHAKSPGTTTKKGGGEERPKAGNNNGQLCIAMPLRVAHAKPPGPILNTIVQGVLG